MATELAAGYVSLTVKMAKGGMADITKEVKKAGGEGGKTYGDEFNKQVSDKVGKNLPDTIGKATKSSGSGGVKQAAKEAASEFGKGILDGIEQELRNPGGVDKSLQHITDRVNQTRDVIKQIGTATGIDTSGIEGVAEHISDAIGGVQTSVEKTKTSFEAFKTGDVLSGLQTGVDALHGLESIGLPPSIVADIEKLSTPLGDAVTQATNMKTTLEGVTTLLATTLPGAAGAGMGKVSAALAAVTVPEWLAFLVSAGSVYAVARGFGQAHDQGLKPETNRFLGGGITDPLTGQPRDPNDRRLPFQSPTAPVSPDLTASQWSGSDPRRLAWVHDNVARSDLHKKGFVPPPGMARGGGIYGSRGSMSDVIPIWASPGEHVLSAADVAKMGGQANVYKFRSMLQGFAGGGAVDNPDVLAAMGLVGTAYSQDARNDCSGMVARVINSVLGMSGSGLMSTKTAQSWLAARGFIPGRGGPGQISVGWYDHGPNPNDGHMAMTLSNGQHAESGGSHGSFLVGAGAQGADSSQFDQHMYLPTVFGEGPGSSGGPSSSSASGGGGSGGGGSTALSDNPMRALQQIGEQQKQLDQQKGEQIKKLLPDFGSLAQIGAEGLKETLLPPGFSDPTQWKSVQSVGKLLGWIGGLTGDPATASIMGGIGSAITGSGSGLYSGIMGAIPQPFGNLAPTADQFGANNNAYAPGAQAAGLPPGALPPGISVGTINDNSGQAVSDLQKTERFNTMGQAMALRNMVRG